MTPRAYEGDEQRRAAEATKDALEGSSLRPAPIAQYRTGCGRDERLKLIWGLPG